jgi:spore maturation protein CgeB
MSTQNSLVQSSVPDPDPVTDRKPRICMPTFSSFAGQAFRMGMREAQDVLAECDNVEFIHLEADNGFAFKERWLVPLVYRDVSNKLASWLNPGLKPVELKKEYDLFILVCPRWRDVWYANAIEGWKDRCKTSICWIDELWSKSLPHIEHWLPALKQFDHVFVGTDGSGEPLSQSIGHPCHQIYGGVDTMRFSPYPNPPERVIDVYSVGRKLEEMHQALLKLASRKEIFYLHDTLTSPSQTGESQSPNHREHRNMYANTAKRSLFYTVSPAKVNFQDETGGQVSVAFRYFEGAAAGAALLGQAPDCEAFRQMFNWPDAVIEVLPDGSDTAEIVSDLIAQPQKLAAINRRNAVETLLRHDWIYRWEHIFNTAGIDISQGLHDRKTQLKKIAEMIGNSQ